MRLHPLARTDLTVYALAFTLGVQLYLLGRVLDSNAQARRAVRRERWEAGTYADHLHERLEAAERPGQAIAVSRRFVAAAGELPEVKTELELEDVGPEAQA